MKRKFIMLSIVLLINVAVYSQKEQIKIAQQTFESGKSRDALGVLSKVEYLIFNADVEIKSDFYYLKGNILRDLVKKDIDVSNNFSAAAEAFQELIKWENDAEKYKYSLQANNALREMKSKWINGAQEDYKAARYTESAEKSYKIYLLDKKDTLNLYDAASTSMRAKDYDAAIKYYEELKKINYSGKGIVCHAINKKTKVEEVFVSPAVRASSITAGTHEKPRDEFSPSKKFEIYKNLAFIYLEKNDFAKAEAMYQDVIKIDPKFIDSYINLTFIQMEAKRELMDKMAALGNTPKELKLYDELKVKKDNIIKSVIPYLQTALSIDPKNQDVIKSLLGVYRSLDMTNEYNSLKATM